MAVTGSLLNNYSEAPDTVSKLEVLDPRRVDQVTKGSPNGTHPLDAQQHKGLPWFAPSQELSALLYVPSEHYRYLMRRFGSLRGAVSEHMHLIPCSEFNVSDKKFTIDFDLVLKHAGKKAFSKATGVAWYAFAALEVLVASTANLLAVPSNISEIQEFRKTLQEKHSMVFSMPRYDDTAAWIVARFTNHTESKSFAETAQDVLLDMLNFRDSLEGGWLRGALADLALLFPPSYLTDRTWKTEYVARCVLQNGIHTDSDVDYVIEKCVELGLKNVLVEASQLSERFRPATLKVLELNIMRGATPPAVWGMMVAMVSLQHPEKAQDIISMMRSLLNGSWLGSGIDLMQTSSDALAS